MTIGQTLKLIRLSKGLSQQAFSTGIISNSYYSKIEADHCHVSADLLFQLLEKAHISLAEFAFIHNDYQTDSHFTLLTTIKLLTQQANINELEGLYQTLVPNNNFPYEGLLVKNLIHYLTDKEIVAQDLSSLKFYLFDTPVWGAYEFQLFYLCTIFMDIDTLLLLAIQIIKNLTKYATFPIIQQDILLTLINLTKKCFINRKIDEATYFLQLAKRLNQKNDSQSATLLLLFFEELLLNNMPHASKETTRLIALFRTMGQLYQAQELETLLASFL